MNNNKLNITKHQQFELANILKAINWEVPNTRVIEWWRKQNFGTEFLRCKKCKDTMGPYPLFLHMHEKHNMDIDQMVKQIYEV